MRRVLQGPTPMENTRRRDRSSDRRGGPRASAPVASTAASWIRACWITRPCWRRCAVSPPAPAAAQVQILLQDAATPQRTLAPLLSLGQRLPSVFAFREVREPVDRAYAVGLHRQRCRAATTSARWAIVSTARPTWTVRAARGNCARSSAGSGSARGHAPNTGHWASEQALCARAADAGAGSRLPARSAPLVQCACAPPRHHAGIISAYSSRPRGGLAAYPPEPPKPDIGPPTSQPTPSWTTS